MAFKRLAKRLKAKSVTLRRVFVESKRNYLEHEIANASSSRLDAKFGAPVITLTNIKPPILAETKYRDADTGQIFHDEDEAREAEKRNLVTLKQPFIPKKKRLRLTLFRRVAQKMEKEKNDHALGVSGIAPKKLRKKLRNMDEERLIDLTHRLTMQEHPEHAKHHKHGHHHHHHHHQHQHNNEETDGNPNSLAIGGQNVTDDAEMMEKYIDYLPGTEIYYGAAISLQARHGGFLSFYHKDGMKATAHKTLPTSRFVILKSSDLTNKNAVKYGDAVWMQATGNEVLGACFSGAIAEGSGRKLLPTMIKTNRRNMFRASQYGRWIFVNRDDPVGSRGKVVKHHHNILVEQEWYYLASTTPEDAHMHKIAQDIDDAVKDRSDIPMELRKRVDYYKCGDECSWKVHLVGIASSDGSGENKRAQLLSNATEQIGESKGRRKVAAKTLLTSMKAILPDELRPESLKETSLRHKQSAYLEQKKLVDRFSRMSSKGFTKQPSIKFIADLYGKDSLIYRKKQEVHRLRDAQIGVEEPPVNWIDIATQRRTELMEARYWDTAQAVLLPTETWHEMGRAMNKYYMTDYNRKINAVLVMQRCIRRRLKHQYTLAKEFGKRDRAANVKIHKAKLHQQSQLMLSGGAFTEGEDTAATATAAAATATAESPQKGPSSDFFLTEGSITDAAAATGTSSVLVGADGPTLEQYMRGEGEIQAPSSPPATLAAIGRGSSAGGMERNDSEHLEEKHRRAGTAPVQQTYSRHELRKIQKEEEVTKKREAARSKMAFSETNSVGLPAKVFDDYVETPGLSVGVKYLRTLTNVRHSGLMEGVDVVKRRPESSSGWTSPLRRQTKTPPASPGMRPNSSYQAVSRSMSQLPTAQDARRGGLGRPQTSGAAAPSPGSRSGARRPSSNARSRR
jgi:hypothetical protein